MSEHYDFHYQPTGSGAISGQQVLQQTEDAINELGDYVNDNVVSSSVPIMSSTWDRKEVKRAVTSLHVALPKR